MIEFMDKSKFNFVLFEDIIGGIKEALGTNKIPYYKFDDQDVDTQLENIMKSLKKLDNLNNSDIFDLIKPLFIPYNNLETLIHKLIRNNKDKSLLNNIGNLIEIKNELQLKKFEMNSLKVVYLQDILNQFKLINDFFIKINNENMKKYYTLPKTTAYFGRFYENGDLDEETIDETVEFFEENFKLIENNFVAKDEYFVNSYIEFVPSNLHKIINSNFEKLEFEDFLFELKKPKNNIYLPDFNYNTPLHLLLEKNKFQIFFRLHKLMTGLENEKDAELRKKIETLESDANISKTFKFIENDFLFEANNLSKYTDLGRSYNTYSLKDFIVSENHNYKDFFEILEYFQKKLIKILLKN